MKYTVLWTPDAEKDLAQLWLQSADRASISRSAHEIERLLQMDPSGVGESRQAGFRILLQPPLGVKYSAEPLDRTVRIYSVWRFRARS